MTHIPFHHESHQISDSTPIAFMLAVTGGYLDAYTYVSRGEVFANAQTGNMVLFGMNLAAGNFRIALTYLIPILSFACGVAVTEQIKWHFKKNTKIHWRQIILLTECVILCSVAFFPKELNMAANCLISFVCALQVDSFRKWHDHGFATTMCTGNLRTATELVCSAAHDQDKQFAIRGIAYYLIILTFIIGAMTGYIITKNFLYYHSVLCAVIPLITGFFLMFFRDNR